MRKRAALVAGLILILAACAQPISSESPVATTIPSPPVSTVPATPDTPLSCNQIHVPYAPEDWYADTPIYVGDEAPWDEVRAFAQGLDGFQDMWSDREHNGWIGVGFTGADVVAHQATLETEFPGVGVVAVEMPYTEEELEEFAGQIRSRLPEEMDTAGVYEVQGYVEVWVGLLTEENVTIATEVIGDLPACITGRDPATTPAPGPQPAGGEGWTYLLEVDAIPGSESSTFVEDAASLALVLEKLGVTGEPSPVDFEQQVVLVLVHGHSGSCPDTRLDAILVEGDLVYAVIPTITDQMACTADWNPRTYLAAVDRSILPPPPFRIETTDRPEPPPPFRQASHRPYIIEPTFPWFLILDVDCGADYLGEINGVHWHRSDGGSGMPPEWEAAAVDGLVDLDLMMTEGPAPTLTASAGGVEILYLPGADLGEYCG